MKRPHPKFSKDVGPRPDLNIEFGATASRYKIYGFVLKK
jgi:hypothetical protein